MRLNNSINYNKKISVYDLILTLSLLTNVACLVHFQDDNKKIAELVEKSNRLTDSINQLNQEITKMGQEITVAQSKSLPVVINTSEASFFNKPLMVLGVLAVSLGTTYFLSSTILAKISSISVPKLISFGSIITKLPFFEQPKEMTLIVKDMCITLFIRTLDDQIQDIRFRHIDDADYRPIRDLFELYIRFKNTQDFSTVTNDTISEKLTNAITGNEVISNTLESLPIVDDSLQRTADFLTNIF